MIAQHVAATASPIRAAFARIGVEGGVLGEVGSRSESPGDDTGTHTDSKALRHD